MRIYTTLTLSQWVGCYFALGAAIVAILYLAAYFTLDAMMVFILVVAVQLSSYYLGKHWGVLILSLDAGFKNSLKSIFYGWGIGFCVLSVTIIAYFLGALIYGLSTLTITDFQHINVHEIISSGVAFPVAFFALTIIFFFGDPYHVLFISSGSAGLLLYVLRKKILASVL